MGEPAAQLGAVDAEGPGGDADLAAGGAQGGLDGGSAGRELGVAGLGLAALAGARRGGLAGRRGGLAGRGLGGEGHASVVGEVARLDGERAHAEAEGARGLHKPEHARAATLVDIHVASTRANGYGFQIETGFRLTSKTAKVVEVPLVFVDRTRGTSKMSAAIMAENLALVEELCEVLTDGSLCALGGLTPLPVRSAIRHFPEDFGPVPQPIAPQPIAAE